HRVLLDFNKRDPTQRNKNVIPRGCATLDDNCQNFNSIYKRKKRLSRSGEKEVDILQLCKATSRDERGGKPFLRKGHGISSDNTPNGMRANLLIRMMTPNSPSYSKMIRDHVSRQTTKLK
ncbi:hypothetical protein Tco_1559433, partial [Tanacetum coccineum]